MADILGQLTEISTNISGAIGKDGIKTDNTINIGATAFIFVGFIFAGIIVIALFFKKD